MNYMEVDTSVLNSDIGTLGTHVSELRKRLTELQAEVTELSGMWSGRANQAFQKQFGNDVDFMNEVFSTVDQLIECMQFAKTEYDKCENEVGDLISSIRI